MYNGPNITSTGLVYGYDTGIGTSTNDITTRLYPGNPTTNLILEPDGNANIITTDVPLGTNVTGYARYDSGYFVNPRNTVSTPASGKTFTYSVYMRSRSSPASTYLMYVFTGTGPDGGWWYFGDGSLTPDWRRYTYTASGLTGNVQVVTVYRYNQLGTIEIAAPQFEEKSYATPFVKGTRSTTQALIDAKRATTIDLSNVSFNSSAQPTFDGTDDYIDLPVSALPAMSQMTIELINFGIDARNSSIIAGGVGGNQDLNIHLPWGDGNIYWDLGRPFNRVYKAAGSDYIGYHHWVFTKNPSTGIMNIYRDGALWAQNTGQTSSIISLAEGQASIGRYSNGSTNAYYHNGIVPVMRIYNVELTATQVAQNFLGYRRRFGI